MLSTRNFRQTWTMKIYLVRGSAINSSSIHYLKPNMSKELKIRRAEKDFSTRSRRANLTLSGALEDRITRYQEELDLRMKNELDEQVGRNKSLLLSDDAEKF
jgi:hypothetical protein